MTMHFLQCLTKLRWVNQLIPVVVQACLNGKVVSLVWINQDALVRLITTGTTVFFSRQRQKIWMKGSSSGETQYLHSLYFNCHWNSILVWISYNKHACHMQKPSCFFVCYSMAVETTVDHYMQCLALRNLSSYSLQLLVLGCKKLVNKITEEINETLSASSSTTQLLLVKECADLCFHLFMLLISLCITPQAVLSELAVRFTMAGCLERSERC